MLFIQEIIVTYHKDVRYANFANVRKSLRFCPIPEQKPEQGEIYFHAVEFVQRKDKMYCNCRFSGTLKEPSFSQPFSQRISVTKENDSYKIGYCGKYDSDFYHTKMILHPDEYGRIVFNKRDVYDYEYSCRWYYQYITYNFINADNSQYRKNLFFRKVPDYEFHDLRKLRYHG